MKGLLGHNSAIFFFSHEYHNLTARKSVTNIKSQIVITASII